MDMRGRHLSREERAVVISQTLRGSGQRQIARLLFRSPGTICREQARGRPEGRSYCAQRGRRVWDQHRVRCRMRRRLVRGGETCRFLCRQLPDLR